MTNARWLDHERLMFIVGDEEIALDVEDTAALIGELQTGNDAQKAVAAKLTEHRPEAA